MKNVNLKTGIRFGIIKTDAIHPDILQNLIYNIGKDVTYQSALDDYLAQERRKHEAEIEEKRIAAAEVDGGTLSEDEDTDFDEDTATERFQNEYQCDEPIHEGEYEGVTWRTTWLGGAQLMWIFESPVLTRCRLCSPCVPGAGDLDSVGEDLAYGVPVAWLDESFIMEKCEEADYEVTLNDSNQFYWFHRDQDLRHTFSSAVISEVWENCYETNLQEKAPCA